MDSGCVNESLCIQFKLKSNQPLRYAGYVYDDYSQMYYCSARYYDPATQVFISIDPARADAERSGYLYCGGDPVNSVDPSGLWRRPLVSYFQKIKLSKVRYPKVRINWVRTAFWTVYGLFMPGPTPGMTGAPHTYSVTISITCVINAEYILKRMGSKKAYCRRHLAKTRSMQKTYLISEQTKSKAKAVAKDRIKSHIKFYYWGIAKHVWVWSF